MLLERGEVQHIGDPEEIGDRYLELNFGRDPQAASAAGHSGGDGEARVLDAWAEDGAGRRSQALAQNQRITLRARVRFAVPVEDPAAAVYVLNEEHKAVIVANTAREQERTGVFAAGDEAVFSFTFDNVLAPGRYSPVFTLAHRGAGVDLLDRFEGASSFVVTGVDSLGGLVDLPVEVSATRPGEAGS
jgi:hypothetical protein